MNEPENEQGEPEPETVEPGDDDDELEDAEPEVEPEPEPEVEPEPVADEERQARLKKITTSFNTYTASVERNMEEDMGDLIACPLCYGTDHPAYLSKHGAGRVPDDVKEAVLLFLGFAREQDYEPDPETQTCRTCKGKGKTATGSQVPGRETRPCPTCKGSGAEGLASVVTPVVGNGHTDEPFTLVTPTSEAAPDADNWGEPRILPDGRENPNWGRQPQFKVPVEPYGITAGLNAVSETPTGVV